jgi:hypothetical protein
MVKGSIGFRNRRRARAASMLCWAAVTAGAVVSGCANDAGDAGTRTVRLNLDFGSGVTLSSVDYVLTRANSGFSRTGSLVVGDQAIVTATFQNLPPGKGYTIAVTGTASDGASTCQGEVMFDVTTNMNAASITTLQIPLTCTGLAAVSATVNICPIVDGLSALPLQVTVGGSITLVAAAHDPDGAPGPLAASWTADGGTLSNLSTTGATFTCTAPGTFNVGVTITDGACSDTSTLAVVCG